MIPCYFVTEAATGNELPATIRPATQGDFEKTVSENWQTNWLTDHIQQNELEKYALEITASKELVLHTDL